MCALFKNKYRIGSKRYAGYDYSLPGKYFITICTQNRIQYFGAVVNRKMVLSESGQVANKLWLEIPEHFPFACLDEYIIMPDHMHGIVIIKNVVVKPLQATVDGVAIEPLRDCVQPLHATVVPISPQNGSLASIIRSYKSAVSKCIHNTDPGFGWHTKFHDHIIRTNIELIRIRNYIILNPEKWK